MKLTPAIRAYFHLQVASRAYLICNNSACGWHGRATGGQYCQDCGKPSATRHRDVDELSAIPDQVRPYLQHLELSYSDAPRNHDLYVAPSLAVELKPGSVLTIEGAQVLLESVVNDERFWDDLARLEGAYDRLEFVAIVEG